MRLTTSRQKTTFVEKPEEKPQIGQNYGKLPCRKLDSKELLGVRGWRRQAIHREEWRHLLKEAKAQKGL